jgi:2-polyprenyl-3-methyl-5-hydroxy-6-metoxy-1,4-benzoquinol methylase
VLDRDREQESLEAIAADSLYGAGANGASVEYCAEVFSRYWKGGSVLELGPAEGLMTAHLDRHFERVTTVEGSERFCEDLRRRFPSITVVHALFEEFEPTERFDAVVLGHVLEHVAEPRDLLARAQGWLTPTGRLFAAVPSARSLHRQAAVLMGLLSSEHELNEMDRHHGHRRVYDPESFRAEFLASGMKIEVFGGYFLKPVSSAQIDADWTPDMLRAFMALGERYPDVAAEIYVVASAG